MRRIVELDGQNRENNNQARLVETELAGDCKGARGGGNDTKGISSPGSPRRCRCADSDEEYKSKVGQSREGVERCGGTDFFADSNGNRGIKKMPT